MDKPCACGCGELIPPFDSRGRPRSFINHHNRAKGRRFISSSGYVLIRRPNHPFAIMRGYVFEHRFIWEQHHNVILLPWADIHHINGIKTDNRIENLEGMMHSQHTKRESSNKWTPERRLQVSCTLKRIRDNGRFKKEVA